eukprot:TRINITY_DN32880_c0_g1_i1.p1 TRINITY_DN32880_c0_g1~~TRINITY_DN32880_c0_g1_i1.p1  ORF type:complete len:294 (+),score=25.89 TRINITY_DN32880_c0_g1_i1:90-884(+)
MALLFRTIGGLGVSSFSGALASLFAAEACVSAGRADLAVRLQRASVVLAAVRCAGAVSGNRVGDNRNSHKLDAGVPGVLSATVTVSRAMLLGEASAILGGSAVAVAPSSSLPSAHSLAPIEEFGRWDFSPRQIPTKGLVTSRAHVALDRRLTRAAVGALLRLSGHTVPRLPQMAAGVAVGLVEQAATRAMKRKVLYSDDWRGRLNQHRSVSLQEADYRGITTDTVGGCTSSAELREICDGGALLARSWLEAVSVAGGVHESPRF